MEGIELVELPMKKVVGFLLLFLPGLIHAGVYYPALYYNFDSTQTYVEDTGPNANHAYVHGDVLISNCSLAPTIFPNSKAAIFFGDDSHLFTNPLQGISAGPWALSMWLMPLNKSASGVLMSSNFKFWISDHSLVLKIGANDSVEIAHNFPARTWAHVAFSVDNSNCNVFVDGQQIYAVGLVDAPVFSDATTPLIIGKTDDSHFYGFMDDLRFYNSSVNNDDMSLIAAKIQDPSNARTTYVMTQSQLESYMERATIDFLRDFIALDPQYFECNPYAVDQTPNAKKLAIASYLVNHSFYESAVPIVFQTPEDVRAFITSATDKQ